MADTDESSETDQRLEFGAELEAVYLDVTIVSHVDVDGLKHTCVEVPAGSVGARGVQVASVGEKPLSDIESPVDHVMITARGSNLSACLGEPGVELGLALPEVGNLHGTTLVGIEQASAAAFKVTAPSLLAVQDLGLPRVEGTVGSQAAVAV